MGTKLLYKLLYKPGHSISDFFTGKVFGKRGFKEGICATCGLIRRHT